MQWLVPAVLKQWHVGGAVQLGEPCVDIGCDGFQQHPVPPVPDPHPVVFAALMGIGLAASSGAARPAGLAPYRNAEFL